MEKETSFREVMLWVRLAMTFNVLYHEIKNELSKEDLSEKVQTLKEELMKLRFKHSSGQLTQSANLSRLRKSIARIRTVLVETSV